MTFDVAVIGGGIVGCTVFICFSMTFDVAVIGGGIVGCAILHQLTQQGYNCVLFEKEDQLASGATGGNSGLLHTGFDALPNTLELKMIRNSYKLYKDLIDFYNIDYGNGAIMVAWNETQLQQLYELERKSKLNGVGDVRMISCEQIHSMEPNINKQEIMAGLLIPGEMMIDSNLIAVTLAHIAVRQGAKILCNAKVEAGTFANNTWHLKLSNQLPIQTRYVINAAGLYGDVIEKIHTDTPKFTIKPRRGQYIVYNKSAGNLINNMLYPVPTDKTKGIIIFKSVYGNLVVGPTAEEVDSRESPTTDPDTRRQLQDYAERIIPELKQDNFQVIGSYAGLRPATSESKDYHIDVDQKMNWICVGGIRSTGQSACLGIAQHVSNLMKNELKAIPSCDPARNEFISKAPAWVTTIPSYILDGVEYHVKHPLMKIGLSSKL